MDKTEIDPRIFDLYDEYCHGTMRRREFLRRAAAITIIGGASSLAMARALLPRYAEAHTISFTDERIKARYADYDSPGGPPAPCAATLCSLPAPAHFPPFWWCMRIAA